MNPEKKYARFRGMFTDEIAGWKRGLERVLKRGKGKKYKELRTKESEDTKLEE